jgi:methylmalonyl-CoA mutase cobalamin-binding subunit
VTAEADGEDTGAGSLPISAVERDTGLSKDTLRVWERRYGFPTPVRGVQAERSYPPQQVQKLRLLKRLVDRGHRPGQVVPLELGALQELASGLGAEGGSQPPALAEWFTHVRRHDAYALRQGFAQALLQLGLARFVTEVVAPMNRAVGEAWMGGQIQIFEEHLYTECVQTTLRQALGTLPPGRNEGPRVLLATVPQEPHGLGLLMAEALFSLQGCYCLSLGVRTPLPEIVSAARAHRTDIVGLSFTDSLNPGQVHSALRELREQLPADVELWAGGQSPALQRRPAEGVLAISDVADVASHVARWRGNRNQGESR